jgi:hypothetical protein
MITNRRIKELAIQEGLDIDCFEGGELIRFARAIEQDFVARCTVKIVTDVIGNKHIAYNLPTKEDK